MERSKYIPQEIEPRWQQYWDEDQLYRALIDQSKEKFYALTMLPYQYLRIVNYCYI